MDLVRPAALRRGACCVVQVTIVGLLGGPATEVRHFNAAVKSPLSLPREYSPLAKTFRVARVPPAVAGRSMRGIMIRTSGALAFGALLLSVCTGSAGAADLYGSYAGSVKDSYVPQPVARSAPSFYLRVDGGYGGHDDPVMVEDGVYDLIQEEMDGAWSFGGGLGYYFTPSLRGDVTVERRFEAEARGTLGDNRSGVAGVRSFGLESTLVMFNMYYDFDNRTRFTPYVGAGLGYVHHETKDGSVRLRGGGTGTIAGASTNDAAGAFMAGVSVALLDQLKLDVGYRFLYMGETTTGALVATPRGGAAVRSNDPTLEELHAHEIKFGLRYDWN